jgi:hypothetical protein
MTMIFNILLLDNNLLPIQRINSIQNNMRKNKKINLVFLAHLVHFFGK